MATYSHTPKAPNLVIGHVIRQTRANDHFAQIHAQGCSHMSRLEGVRPFAGVEANERYVDDYYYVAPCARRAAK